jgi:hypothetical protein
MLYLISHGGKVVAVIETANQTHQKLKQIDEVFHILKNKILLYPNLYIPDFIIYDLAKAMVEFYEEIDN